MAQKINHSLASGDFVPLPKGENDFEAGQFTNQAKTASEAARSLDGVGMVGIPAAAVNAFGTPDGVILLFAKRKNRLDAEPECYETKSLIVPAGYYLPAKSTKIRIYPMAHKLGGKGKTPIANGTVHLDPRALWWDGHNCEFVICGPIRK